MVNHSSKLAVRSPWTVSKGKNILQWGYNKAQGPLEVKSSAIFYKVGYNQLLPCPMATSFYTVHEVLTASILGGLPFPPPVDHILSELSAMIRPSWVALHDMAHSFIELHKPLHYNKAMMQAGRVTSWNQDRQEKHQQPQICGWYHSSGRNWRETKEPLDENEGGAWKSPLKIRY